MLAWHAFPIDSCSARLAAPALDSVHSRAPTVRAGSLPPFDGSRPRLSTPLVDRLAGSATTGCRRLRMPRSHFNAARYRAYSRGG